MHHAGGQRDLLLFHVGPHYCAMPLDGIEEVAPLAATVRLPGQPPIVGGFFNLRGRAVPVVRLARLFGMSAEDQPPLSSVVIVAFAGSRLSGFLADGVEGVATVSASHLESVSAELSLNHCAEWQFPFDGRQFALLSLERMLMAQEQACLANLTEQAQSRLAELADAGA